MFVPAVIDYFRFRSEFFPDKIHFVRHKFGFFRIIFVAFSHDYAKFVSADSGNVVAGSKSARKHVCNMSQHLVSDYVAIRVVNFLKKETGPKIINGAT